MMPITLADIPDRAQARKRLWAFVVKDNDCEWLKKKDLDTVASLRLQSFLAKCGGPGSGVPGPCPEGGEESKEKKPAASEPKTPRVPEQEPSDVAKRAKDAHVMVDRSVQRYAEEYNEPRLAKALGGVSFPDSKRPPAGSHKVKKDANTLLPAPVAEEPEDDSDGSQDHSQEKLSAIADILIGLHGEEALELLEQGAEDDQAEKRLSTFRSKCGGPGSGVPGPCAEDGGNEGPDKGKEAIEFYQGEGYFDINEGLRGKHTLSDKDKETINTLDSLMVDDIGGRSLQRGLGAAFGGARLLADIGFDREEYAKRHEANVQWTTFNAIADQFKLEGNARKEAMQNAGVDPDKNQDYLSLLNAVKGKEISDPGYASFTSSGSVARSFMDQDKGEDAVVVDLRTAAGAKGIDVNKQNPHEADVVDEREYILPRGTKMRVTDIDRHPVTDGWRVSVEMVSPGDKAEKCVSGSLGMLSRTLAAFCVKGRWVDEEHPRDEHGRFAAVGREGVDNAHKLIKKLKGGKGSPKDTHDLTNQLSKLTIKQLNELKDKHGFEVAKDTKYKRQLINAVRERIRVAGGKPKGEEKPDKKKPEPKPEPEPEPEKKETKGPDRSKPIMERMEADTESKRIVEDLAGLQKEWEAKSSTHAIAVDKCNQFQSKVLKKKGSFSKEDSAKVDALATVAEKAKEAMREAMRDHQGKALKILAAKNPASTTVEFMSSGKDIERCGNAAHAFLSQVLDKNALTHTEFNFIQVDGRAHYNRDSLGMTGLGVSSVDPKRDPTGSIAVHEAGHHLEGQIPHAEKAANDFLDHRLKGETPQQLSKVVPGSGYGPDEYGAKDDFEKTFNYNRNSAYYAGKRYSTGQTEVVSMGLEHLHRDPVGFASRDPEYARFLVGLMHGRI